MSTWRFFIGRWDDQEVSGHDTRVPWAEARDRIARTLARFRDEMREDCPGCSEQATTDLARLLALPPDSEFVAEVEGDHYCLVRPDREGIQDLLAAGDSHDRAKVGQPGDTDAHQA